MRPSSPITSELARAPVLRFEGVGKRYAKQRVRPFLLRDVWRLPPRSDGADGQDSFWALAELDLELGAGEAVAIVGENGSGKSTLLALVAGATHPTQGCVSVRGRLAPLLQLGVGFQWDMSAPENAYINASLLGLPREDAARRLPEMLAFADLGDFVDVPLRYHSRGMVARLGFAVATHVDADVLLVDEVIAVGDGAFQEKCFARIRQLRDAGTTILLVTHDLESARRFATRLVWLRGGRIAYDGSPEEGLARYQAFLDGSR